MIRQSLEAMQKQVAGMENPLLEAGAYQSGHRIAFRHQDGCWSPLPDSSCSIFRRRK